MLSPGAIAGKANAVYVQLTPRPIAWLALVAPTVRSSVPLVKLPPCTVAESVQDAMVPT